MLTHGHQILKTNMIITEKEVNLSHGKEKASPKNLFLSKIKDTVKKTGICFLIKLEALQRRWLLRES